MKKNPPKLNHEIAERCDRIIKFWRSTLKTKTEQQQKQNPQKDAKIREKRTEHSNGNENDVRDNDTQIKLAKRSKSDTSSDKSNATMPEFTKLNDATRNKCIEMVYNALMTEEGLNAEHAMNLAVEIELELFRISGNKVDTKYKSSFRSKYLNLKDKSNPDLRQSVLYGGISVKQFLQMSAQVRFIIEI